MKKNNLPNQLTILRIFLIPVFMIFLSVPLDLGSLTISGIKLPVAQLIAAIIFAVASFTDWLDGFLARRWHLVSNFGKFADPLADKMLVMSAFVFLITLGKAPAWIVAIIVCRELAVTGLRLLIVEQNGSVLAAAWPGKLKTATQMFAIIFLLLNNIPFGTIRIDLILLYLCLIFTIYSGYDYFIKNLKVFK